jgi:hypothetical protein
MTDKNLLPALKEAIRQSIVVLNALPRSDASWLALGSAWAGANDDPALAYGYAETVIRITPTAREISQAEIVFDWLSWLGAQDGSAVPRLKRWAKGLPLWQIADIERCSERTVANRIDRSVAKILREFGDTDVKIEIVEEPRRKHDYRLGFAAPDPVDTDETSLRGARVYIGGVGWMRRRRGEGRWKRHRSAVDQAAERVNAN